MTQTYDAAKVAELLAELDTAREAKHILFRHCEGKNNYAHLVSSGHPSIGYGDDGCRSISVVTAELADEHFRPLLEQVQRLTAERDEAAKQVDEWARTAGRVLAAIQETADFVKSAAIDAARKGE